MKKKSNRLFYAIFNDFCILCSFRNSDIEIILIRENNESINEGCVQTEKI